MSVFSVGIVGCGSHCRDIARLFARAGLEVHVLPWGHADGKAGLWPVDEVVLCSEPSDLYECDLVLQCVPGSVDAQLQAIRALEPHLSAGAILGLTTALAPLAAFLPSLTRPAQAVGIYFPRPVDACDRIEITPSDETAPGVYRAVVQLCEALDRAAVSALPDAAE